MNVADFMYTMSRCVFLVTFAERKMLYIIFWEKKTNKQTVNTIAILECWILAKDFPEQVHTLVIHAAYIGVDIDVNLSISLASRLFQIVCDHFQIVAAVRFWLAYNHNHKKYAKCRNKKDSGAFRFFEIGSLDSRIQNHNFITISCCAKP